MDMVLIAAFFGLLLSVVIESRMEPRPRLWRPIAAWAIHGGLWLLFYAVMLLLLGRPWFSSIAVLAFFLLLIVINNAKYTALQEPFLYQDYNYFTDAIQHPRFYLPFLGESKLLIAGLVFGVTVIALGLWGESVPEHRWSLDGQAGAAAGLLLLASGLLVLGHRAVLPVSFHLQDDVRSLGFLAFLWRYAVEGKRWPQVHSGFATMAPTVPPKKLPHLVAVQSESFFDPRRLYAGIRPEVLAEFDKLKTASLLTGKLEVSAWGANTIRSEFAFLSGIEANKLGVHQFSPYRPLAQGWPLATLATYLKQLGYRTLCIHPYPASFYQRNIVYPRIGFDEFLDISVFAGAERFGPYMSDKAVTDKVIDVLKDASQPVFVFVITMENHGPLHLEKISSDDVSALYNNPPPEQCDDLTVYLRHLRNADRMIERVSDFLANCPWEGGASLCWYGDHVPIMPSVYQICGTPDGKVDYLVWSSFGGRRSAASQDIPADKLAESWLTSVGLF